MIEVRNLNEARAKVFWDEKPEQVVAFLQSKGGGEKEALRFVATFRRERIASLRKSGIRLLILGGGLLALSTTQFLILEVAGLWRLMLVAGIFGLILIVKGIFCLIIPSAEKGGLAKKDY